MKKIYLAQERAFFTSIFLQRNQYVCMFVDAISMYVYWAIFSYRLGFHTSLNLIYDQFQKLKFFCLQNKHLYKYIFSLYA